MSKAAQTAAAGSVGATAYVFGTMFKFALDKIQLPPFSGNQAFLLAILIFALLWSLAFAGILAWAYRQPGRRAK